MHLFLVCKVSAQQFCQMMDVEKKTDTVRKHLYSYPYGSA